MSLIIKTIILLVCCNTIMYHFFHQEEHRYGSGRGRRAARAERYPTAPRRSPLRWPFPSWTPSSGNRSCWTSVCSTCRPAARRTTASSTTSTSCAAWWRRTRRPCLTSFTLSPTCRARSCRLSSVCPPPPPLPHPLTLTTPQTQSRNQTPVGSDLVNPMMRKASSDQNEHSMYMHQINYLYYSSVWLLKR